MSSAIDPTPAAPEPSRPLLAIDPEMLLTFATVLFGLSVRASSPAAGTAVALATILCALVFWSIRSGADLIERDPERQELRLLVAVLGFSCLVALWWAPSWIGPTSEGLERIPALVWAGLAMWLYSTKSRLRLRPVFIAITAITLATTLVAGLIHVAATEGVGVDVYLLHQSAADAIADGQNPYTDVVEVPNGAPTAAPDDTIVGYPYPPLAALIFSLGEWSVGDPRYAGVVCWVVVLGMIGVSAVRRENRRRMYVMLLLASIPGWPLVLRAGWTEPLTLVFLTAAFLVWRRATVSGIGLGLGVASKQYFAVAAPLLILHRDGGWLRRLGVAAGVIVLAVGPAFALDPEAFWRSAVDFHTSTPLRTDSVNVIGALQYFGISWGPPRWLGPALGIVVAIVTGRISRTRQSFFLGMALALATSFLFASQALANYWFLITGLCALVLSDGSEDQIVSAESDPSIKERLDSLPSRAS